MNHNSKYQSAFTILELLVVIGIIAILAITLLFSLNPAEAQRRARDVQRQKDINTMQTLVEQIIAAEATPTNCQASAPCYSSSIPGSTAQSCSTNWTGHNVCQFAQTVPVDPLNGQSSTCVNSLITKASDCLLRYRLIFEGTNYEISVMQESQPNAAKTVNDGGTATNDNSIYQIYSQSPLTTNSFTVEGATADAK